MDEDAMWLWNPCIYISDVPACRYLNLWHFCQLLPVFVIQQQPPTLPPLPLLSIYPSLVCLHTWVSLTPSLPFSSLCLFVCFPSVSGADTLQSALHAGITIISINSYFKCFKTHTHTHIWTPQSTLHHMNLPLNILPFTTGTS